VGKITEKAVCTDIFDNMALYFECRINKTILLQSVLFSDFSHWVFTEQFLTAIDNLLARPAKNNNLFGCVKLEKGSFVNN